MNAAEGWLGLLREECERATQREVSDRLGISTSVVCQTLKGKYRGNLANIQELVESVFGGATVACPVLGDLPRHECLNHQRREFAASNWQVVALYKACRNGCAHGKGGTKGGA